MFAHQSLYMSQQSFRPAERDSYFAWVVARKLCESAGRHFNRGQRAFFFALGYLGWFVSPWLLFATTAAIFAVMWVRQFASDARAAMTAE